jgi:prepilin signal peptidase PulO-like enzyme (type II secretory pathway)
MHRRKSKTGRMSRNGSCLKWSISHPAFRLSLSELFLLSLPWSFPLILVTFSFLDLSSLVVVFLDASGKWGHTRQCRILSLQLGDLGIVVEPIE